MRSLTKVQPASTQDPSGAMAIPGLPAETAKTVSTSRALVRNQTVLPLWAGCGMTLTMGPKLAAIWSVLCCQLNPHFQPLPGFPLSRGAGGVELLHDWPGDMETMAGNVGLPATHSRLLSVQVAGRPLVTAGLSRCHQRSLTQSSCIQRRPSHRRLQGIPLSTAPRPGQK